MEINLLALLVGLIVFGLVWWAIHAVAGAFGIPAQVMVLVKVLLVVIAVLWLLSAIGLLNVPIRVS